MAPGREPSIFNSYALIRLRLAAIVGPIMLVYAFGQYERGDYIWMAIDLILAAALITVVGIYWYLTYEKPNPDNINTDASTGW